mmetsp:Transcript_26904/g.78337  ORF Transcript_26904/g.78337 Transcript_26904/m.78337 type:complete len:410 (-) Transcript_26904:270-1499(-)
MAVLAEAPHGHVDEGQLGQVLVHEVEEVVHDVPMKFLGHGDVHDGVRCDGLITGVSRDGEHGDECVYLPASGRSILVHGIHNFGAQGDLLLRARHDQVVECFSCQVNDVLRVGQLVDEFQGPLADGDIWILEAVHNGGPVALHGIHVLAHDLGQGVQCHVANVVVTVEQESPEDVHGEDSECGLCFDGHDGLDTFIEDGISGVLGRLCVRRHLGEDVVHGFTRLLVALSEELQEAEKFHLEEWVRNAGNVMFRGVAHGEQVLQESDEVGDETGEGLALLGLHLDDGDHELDASNENTMGAVLHEAHDLVGELLDHFRHALEDADHHQGRLLLDEGVGPTQAPFRVTQKVAAHVPRGQVAQGRQCQPNNVLVRVGQIQLDRIRHQGQHLGGLVEQQHEGKVANALLGEIR